MGKYAEQRNEEKDYSVTPEQAKWLQAKFGTGKAIVILDLAAEFAEEFNVELHLAETKVGLWMKVKTGKSTL
tara:strand:+ start:595 stop:810 length:216 start_codon:yes stop_codon:yes gene_type:complete